MTIPAGFKIKEGENIDTGIVVQDRAENEFVWVPVAINDMVMCKSHTTAKITYENGQFSCFENDHHPSEKELVGKLYATTTGNSFTAEKANTTYDANSGLREPAIVTGDSSGEGTKYDGDAKNLSIVVEGVEKTRAKFLEQLQNEFYNMAKSVAKYGGFYIGRYESSGLKDGEKPIVQKEKSPTVSTNWYTMYKNSKNLAQEGTQVTSSMIWGCQWDQVMLWMQEVDNPTVPGAKYIKDGSGMGWYSGVRGSDNNTNDEHKTGIDLTSGDHLGEVLNRVKNIYDLGGNVSEWTLEAGELRESRCLWWQSLG